MKKIWYWLKAGLIVGGQVVGAFVLFIVGFSLFFISIAVIVNIADTAFRIILGY